MENDNEPKHTISLYQDDPWKNHEDKWRKNPCGEGKPSHYSDISWTKMSLRKKPRFKKQSLLKNDVNQLRPYLQQIKILING